MERRRAEEASGAAAAAEELAESLRRQLVGVQEREATLGGELEGVRGQAQALMAGRDELNGRVAALEAQLRQRSG